MPETDMPGTDPAGALQGVRVVELASEAAGLAGKLLADMGADVVVVEAPGGSPVRRYGPFAGDRPGVESSLWWWYYNTSKRSVVVDVDDRPGLEALRSLVGRADIVIEAEPPGRLAALGADHETVRLARPGLIWVTLTPFGTGGPRGDDPFTDLTLLAGGGVVWNCGYDDHTLPPVRGGGNQGFHIASTFAAMGALTALVQRDLSGTGQHVEVNMHAAVNVTTESGTFNWLVANETIGRQTGRHAAVNPTMPVQTLAADGRYVTTGFLPHSGEDFQAIIDWIESLGIAEGFPDLVLLQMGADRGGVDPRTIAADPEAAAILGSSRDALHYIASKVTAYEFFIGTQERDMQCGIIYSPEEALQDRHFVERGFPVPVHHPELGRDIVYPGAPFKMGGTPWRISRRPPLLGEHTSEVLEEWCGP